MTDDQFDKLVDLLTDIKNSIDSVAETQIASQQKLKDIYRMANSIDLSIIGLDTGSKKS